MTATTQGWQGEHLIQRYSVVEVDTPYQSEKGRLGTGIAEARGIYVMYMLNTWIPRYLEAI